MTQHHLTLRSRNGKVGPIPVSTSSADTCPPDCPLRGNGCYAQFGPLSLFWARVNNGTAGETFAAFIAHVAALPLGQLWRHNQAGDLPGDGNAIDAARLAELVSANEGKRGFTYTHKPMLAGEHAAANRAAIAHANAHGFAVNLSGDNLAEADRLAELGIAPVVTLLPKDATDNTTTPAGRRVVICPEMSGRSPNCAACKLCAVIDRTVIVGFPAHGTGARKAHNIATE